MVWLRYFTRKYNYFFRQRKKFLKNVVVVQEKTGLFKEKNHFFKSVFYENTNTFKENYFKKLLTTVFKKKSIFL